MGIHRTNVSRDVKMAGSGLKVFGIYTEIILKSLC